VKVKAKAPGFFGSVRKKPGDVFDVSEKQFSKRWMERLDATAVSSGDAEKLAVKTAGKNSKEATAKSSGDAEVI
jgi:hypothetical protein